MSADDAPFNNGNYCECCESYGDVQLYIDRDDNAVDLCLACYQTLTSAPNADNA